MGRSLKMGKYQRTVRAVRTKLRAKVFSSSPKEIHHRGEDGRTRPGQEPPAPFLRLAVGKRPRASHAQGHIDRRDQEAVAARSEGYEEIRL